MKRIKTIERIELTSDEVRVIVDALQFHWKALANIECSPQDFAKQADERLEIKRLRNEMANIINRGFMGADA